MSKIENTKKLILKRFKVSPYTHKVLTDFFSNISDKDFHNFMVALRDKQKTLSFIIPHDEQHSERDLLDVLDSIGVNVFQKLTYISPDGFEYTGIEPTLVLTNVIKRAAQTQDKKVSIPTGNKINSLTGQVTGESLSAQYTLPESFIHIGYGALETPNEFINVRGGDLGLSNALDKELFTNGTASLANIQQYSTKNVTTKTLKAYLLASHLKSTL